MFDLIVVGGGAAGFYGAIHAAEKKPDMKILILEKSSKVLAKVKVSGGGRCNVTHHGYNPDRLARHYPRGEKAMKALFRRYQPIDVVAWFESKGVQIKAEGDGRMFPATNSSQTIIDCMLKLAQQYDIRIERNCEVTRLEQFGDQFRLGTQSGENFVGKNVLVATGGSPHQRAYQWIADAGHTITTLAPSLFTFNDPSKKFAHLMGVSVNDASVKIAGTKFSQRGPVLITHWGLSGPAVIRLSAWAAIYLGQRNYEFTVLVNWLDGKKEDELREELLQLKSTRANQRVGTNAAYSIPQRLWTALCLEAEITATRTWSELSNRHMNKLIEMLVRCDFAIKGKTTFREEFVTCGGVNLDEINLDTLESKKIGNLYFAGEVINIDGETGGFNFQAAWTTAWVAAQSIAKKEMGRSTNIPGSSQA